MEPRVCTLRERVQAELPMKVALALILPIIFGICYFGLQELALFPPRGVPSTWIDEHVPFDPLWVWPYQSIYLLVPLLPWLATRRAELWCYFRGWAVLCGICFAIFLLAPVRGPEQPDAEHWGYRFLISYVGQFNAFPSLHAGLAAYTVLFGHRLLRAEASPVTRVAFTGMAVVWTGFILYGTLATKQHWVVDLPAGMLAAWIGHTWAWRRFDRTETAASPAAAIEDSSEQGRLT